MYIKGEVILDLVDAKTCLVSKNIIDSLGNVCFVYREEPVVEIDSGWRIFSEIDTEEFINKEGNVIPVDFNDLCNLEPSLTSIYEAPIGTDLAIEDGIFYGTDDEEFDCTGMNIAIKPGNIVLVDNSESAIKNYVDGLYELEDGRKVKHGDIEAVVGGEREVILG